MKTTIFLFHPNLKESRANAALIKDTDIEVRDIYELYPDSNIDVKAEQDALTKADRIVWQFPMYWFSGPSLLKKWQDLVLEHGWAYGHEGHALDGKELMLSVTVGVSEREYQVGGKQGHTINEYLFPIIDTAKYTRMKVLKSFIVDDVFRISDTELVDEAQRYHQILNNLGI